VASYPYGAALVPGPVAWREVKPFGFVSLPADVVNSLLLLPAMAERLDEIATHTADLAAVREAIEGVKQDTSVLPGVDEATSSLDERMRTIEEAMPALLEVQQRLTDLPEILDQLGTLMERLLASMDRLDERVGTLQSSMEPLGRLADRLPGGSRG
jgi:DNA repair ATPase RecN